MIAARFLTPEEQDAAWLEDLTDMAEWGVPFHEAAARAGFEDSDRMRRWLSKNRHSQLLRRLTANSHRQGLNSEGGLLDRS